MSDSEQYPWTRRPDETPVAYEAFRIYMNGGHTRSLANVAEAMGGNRRSAINKWSSAYEWVARTTAYDSYLTTAGVDGLASQMASARDENLSLADEMRAHAFVLLRGFIDRNEVPPGAFSQFIVATARLEEHAFRLKDDPKTTSARSRVEEYLRRIEQAGRS